MGLTPVQEEFCLLYVSNGYNAGKAYYTLHPDGKRESANKSAYKYMQNPEIKQRIADLRKEKMDALSIDADRVLEKLGEIAFADKGDEYYKTNDQLKALNYLIKSLGMENKTVTVQQEEIEVEVV